MDILEIKNQHLSLLLSDHYVCEYCHFVDRDKGRSCSGHKCNVCGTPGERGKLYFPFNIHTLINLMQEAYHSTTAANTTNSYNTGRDSHNISIILFFCTLRESLLYNLVHELCISQKITENIFDRLFSDNKFHKQKQDKLFPSLTNTKWKDAIKDVDGEELDFKTLDDFIVSVVQSRNRFVHSGSKYGISEEMPENCIRNIGKLITLYVKLHNKYAHPEYLSDKTSKIL